MNLERRLSIIGRRCQNYRRSRAGAAGFKVFQALDWNHQLAHLQKCKNYFGSFKKNIFIVFHWVSVRQFHQQSHRKCRNCQVKTARNTETLYCEWVSQLSTEMMTSGTTHWRRFVGLSAPVDLKAGYGYWSLFIFMWLAPCTSNLSMQLPYHTQATWCPWATWETCLLGLHPCFLKSLKHTADMAIMARRKHLNDRAVTIMHQKWHCRKHHQGCLKKWSAGPIIVVCYTHPTSVSTMLTRQQQFAGIFISGVVHTHRCWSRSKKNVKWWFTKQTVSRKSLYKSLFTA